MLNAKTPKFLPPAAASAEVARTGQALETAKAAENVSSTASEESLTSGWLLSTVAYEQESKSKHEEALRAAAKAAEKQMAAQNALGIARGEQAGSCHEHSQSLSHTTVYVADSIAEHRKDLEVASAFANHFATVVENIGFVVQDDERALHEAEVQRLQLFVWSARAGCG